jgi:hypothetical protein
MIDRVAEASDAVAELLGPFERDQVAAPGDDVELGAVDLGHDVALDPLDGLDLVWVTCSRSSSLSVACRQAVSRAVMTVSRLFVGVGHLSPDGLGDDRWLCGCWRGQTKPPSTTCWRVLTSTVGRDSLSRMRICVALVHALSVKTAISPSN